MPANTHRSGFIRLTALVVLLFLSSVGCSLGEMLVGEPTPTPTAVPPTPRPTWTALAPDQLPPAVVATLTVQAAVDLPTLTPTPTPIPTSTPTFTPVVFTPTPEVSPTPTPYLLVERDAVNVRSGPSIAYPVLGTARAGDTFVAVGRNEAATWWQVCCLDGVQGWISAQVIVPVGSMADVAIVPAAEPPPISQPQQPQATPLPTDTPLPYRPFTLGGGPLFYDSTNPWLTIWVKVYRGREPFVTPVEGYGLRVLRNGVDVSQSNTSRPVFEFSAPYVPDKPFAYGNRQEYNLKYEFQPRAGDAEWTIFLVDWNGVQVSPEVVFRTEEAGTLREVYVGFADTR